jgi:hypothetical protein
VYIRDKITKLKKGEISKEAERFELKDIDVPNPDKPELTIED